MRLSLEKVRKDNERKYGTDISQYGPVLLANLYSERTHFLYELLQNAEDAGATSVDFKVFPDKLELTHNGRPFTQDDVVSICGLVSSTKADDLNKIGKFGIGFKSVFAYTRSPYVHSGPFHFRILNFVQPFDVHPHAVPEGKTQFIFPLDVPDLAASEEIVDGLRRLDSRALLFLRNLRRISWTDAGGASGGAERETESHQAGTEVVALRSLDGQSTERWLVFSEPAPPPPGAREGDSHNMHLQVAWKLGQSAEGKDRVEGVERLPLFVYFPTEKITYFRCAIQGPYRTTPARDNVPQHDPWNIELTLATGVLVVDALKRLRELGLLDVSALNTVTVLNGEHGFLGTVHQSVAVAILNEDLIPTEDGIHVRASRARLGRGAGLRKLLEPASLAQVTGVSEARWASADISSDKTPELWRYLKTLKVQELDGEAFVRNLTPAFLLSQPLAWMAQFYDYLAGQQRLWYPLRTAILAKKAFLLTECGRVVTAVGEDGSPNIYLPPDGPTEFTVVHRFLAEHCKPFLEKLGIKEPDLMAEVQRFILPKYREAERAVPLSEHIADLGTIRKALRQSSSERQFHSAVMSTPILLARQPSSGKVQRRKPSEIYSPSPELMQFFEGHPDIWFLHEAHWGEGCDLPGAPVRTEVEVRARSARNGFVVLRELWGDHERGVDGFDPIARVPGLKHALKNINAHRAEFIWNRILLPNQHLIRGQIQSSPKADYPSNRTENREAISELGLLVTSTEWLPDDTGSFGLPATRTLEDLPPTFRRDETLASQLGLRSSALVELARQSGISLDLLNYAAKHPDAVREFLAAAAKKEKAADKNAGKSEEPLDFRAELEEQFNKPAGPQIAPDEEPVDGGRLRNPDLRRERIRESIETGQATEPTREDRFRLVPATRWEPKDQSVRAALYEWYSGRCQICAYTFRRRDGRAYFEALYLVSRTEARWVERPGNTLCLCPNCCARWLHSEVTHETSIVEALLGLDVRSATLQVGLSLSGEAVKLKYCAKHLLELQELLKS